MEFLRNWIEQIALAVIIASIFEMILPNGKTKKYIKMILGVFIVFSIISPFVNSTDLYNIDVNEIIGDYAQSFEIDNTTSQNSTDEKIEDLYINELEKDISKKVEEQGFEVESCEIEAIIYSDNDDAGIENINIVLLSKNENNVNNSDDDTNSSIQTINEVEIGVNIDNNTNESEDNSITEKDIKKLKNFLSDYYEIDKKVINIVY